MSFSFTTHKKSSSIPALPRLSSVNSCIYGIAVTVSASLCAKVTVVPFMSNCASPSVTVLYLTAITGFSILLSLNLYDTLSPFTQPKGSRFKK